MQEPSTPVSFTEDVVIRAFQAANAFREALQTLVTASRSAGFTVGMEAEERSGRTNKSADAPTEMQRLLHTGKQAASG